MRQLHHMPAQLTHVSLEREDEMARVKQMARDILLELRDGGVQTSREAKRQFRTTPARGPISRARPLA